MAFSEYYVTNKLPYAPSIACGLFLIFGVLVITSKEIMKESAKLFGAEVIKLKDYDKINAIYLGLKKAKEMGYEPLVILEDLSMDEKILISLRMLNLSLDRSI